MKSRGIWHPSERPQRMSMTYYMGNDALLNHLLVISIR